LKILIIHSINGTIIGHRENTDLYGALVRMPSNFRLMRTENPKIEQWKLLGQYAYPTNIRKYLNDRGFNNVDNRLIEFIVGCVRQSEAYFTAAENSPLDISPLLSYYGTVNLLAAAYVMVTGCKPEIKTHGMRLLPLDDKDTKIADAKVKPINPQYGALQLFCNALSGNCQMGGVPWTVEEILGSIPDLKKIFESCYPNAITYTIPVETLRKQRVIFERIDPKELARYNKPEDVFKIIIGLSSAYLEPQYSGQMEYIVLHRKIGGNEIGIYSIFGQKYLQVAHLKNNKLLNPSDLIVMFMGLFAFGYLSRYYPEIWNPFVRSDETGEKLVVEGFLQICQRYLPNLVLGLIYGERVQFINESEKILDISSLEKTHGPSRLYEALEVRLPDSETLDEY